MSDSNKIVSVIFEQVADEQDLYSPRHQAVIANGANAQPIDHIQTMIIEGLIYRQAKRYGHPADSMRVAFECRFKVLELKKLPRYLFDEALTYLDGLPGMN